MTTTDLFDLPAEPPAVERIGCAWYACDVQSLLASPCGLRVEVVQELRVWEASRDVNVVGRRPFCVETFGGNSSYSFDWFYRRDFAPQWWVAAARGWGLQHGYDHRGRRVHAR